MDKQSASLRKRQQIGRANRMMFLTIAGISVVVGVSIVLAIFLVQRILFGEKVLSAKRSTDTVLQKNLDNVSALRDNINVLNTNEALASSNLNDSNTPVQAVLDALPADANPTALASSLQTKLLTGVPGVTIETINVDAGVGSTSAASPVPTVGAVTSNQIGFSFSISTGATNYDSLRQVLAQVERSIRPFNITNVDIEAQGTKVVLTATGISYYEPAQTVQLTQKVVKP